MNELIIDGGTTNLRVYLNRSGTVIASSSADGGVRRTAIEGSNSTLRSLLKSCIEEVLYRSGCCISDIDRCIAFGMITSGLGLYEIPHLSAPAGIRELHDGMKTARFTDICPFDISFIPGVRNFYGHVDTSNVSGMDMMRGEETESIGLYNLIHLDSEALLVLPGSHNKFVHMSAEGRILGCMTSVSGELIDAVTHHTILSGAVESRFCSADEYDRSLAVKGAEECLRSGIGRAAFAGRILNTLGELPPSAIRSYLLGAVLAEDIRAMQSFTGSSEKLHFVVTGKAPLQQAMCDVLTVSGVRNLTAVTADISSTMGIHGAELIANG